MNKKHLMSGIVIVLLLFITPSITAQTYREIKGWSKEINERIETFLNTTLTMNIRKVAVFDGDGTVVGQAPHYLADEALYRYADKFYKGKSDKFSKEKMAILNRMVKDGNNVGKAYVEDRAHFLAGMTPRESVAKITARAPHGTARYRQVQLSNAIDPSIREAASMRADCGSAAADCGGTDGCAAAERYKMKELK